MVPNISRSRVHLISTHVLILASLILLTGVIAIISAKSNGGTAICSDNFTDITELIKCCDNCNKSMVNLSLDLKLDFCVDAFPLALISKSSSGSNTSTNNTSCPIPKTVSVSCADIKDIRGDDLEIKRYHDSYVDILKRSEFSLDARDKSGVENCTKAYKDWLCSSTLLKYKLNNSELKGCESTSQKVCLHCPSFKPEDTYGGFMAFQCNESKEDKEDINSYPPKCISPETLSTYNKKVRKECAHVRDHVTKC